MNGKTWKKRHEHLAIKYSTFERFNYLKQEESADVFLKKLLGLYERVLAKRAEKGGQ